MSSPQCEEGGKDEGKDGREGEERRRKGEGKGRERKGKGGEGRGRERRVSVQSGK